MFLIFFFGNCPVYANDLLLPDRCTVSRASYNTYNFSLSFLALKAINLYRAKKNKQQTIL